MNRFARLDQQYLWHPFTQMRDWLKQEPIVIARGRGSELIDVKGRVFLDANASIWTNLHGHNHPALNRALRTQLEQIAHSSALGLANQPASLLAQDLIQLANRGRRQPRLAKVFYSDDGSTALEVSLKLAYEFSRRTRGLRRPRFLSLEGAYHGDTIGAVSLGHIDLFHKAYAGLLFSADRVMAPYCYRCPYNRAKPERADARDYRQCHWECVDQVARKFESRPTRSEPYAAFLVEPLMQGAAGMVPQPKGWLKKVAAIAREHQALLIADEVMTAFGRTGGASAPHPTLLASHSEGVQPDLLALAKGLSGGYLPLAATLATREIFDAFLGQYNEFKTFFHGHSFTANQLGTATARASLDLLKRPSCIRNRARIESDLRQSLGSLWSLPAIGDIRQVGLVAGIELVKDWRTRRPFDLQERAGIRVCEAMIKRGVLTRPIGNVVVLMPPYSTTSRQVRRMVGTLADAIQEVFPSTSKPRTKGA